MAALQAAFIAVASAAENRATAGAVRAAQRQAAGAPPRAHVATPRSTSGSGTGAAPGCGFVDALDELGFEVLLVVLAQTSRYTSSRSGDGAPANKLAALFERCETSGGRAKAIRRNRAPTIALRFVTRLARPAGGGNAKARRLRMRAGSGRDFFDGAGSEDGRVGGGMHGAAAPAAGEPAADWEPAGAELESERGGHAAAAFEQHHGLGAQVGADYEWQAPGWSHSAAGSAAALPGARGPALAAHQLYDYMDAAAAAGGDDAADGHNSILWPDGAASTRATAAPRFAARAFNLHVVHAEAAEAGVRARQHSTLSDTDADADVGITSGSPRGRTGASDRMTVDSLL
jgi:hypothetical protein